MAGNPAKGPIPLLLQGLVEQLPTDRQWTRAEARLWLAAAERIFDVLYDFVDKGVA